MFSTDEFLKEKIEKGEYIRCPRLHATIDKKWCHNMEVCEGCIGVIQFNVFIKLTKKEVLFESI